MARLAGNGLVDSLSEGVAPDVNKIAADGRIRLLKRSLKKLQRWSGKLLLVLEPVAPSRLSSSRLVHGEPAVNQGATAVLLWSAPFPSEVSLYKGSTELQLPEKARKCRSVDMQGKGPHKNEIGDG